MTSRILAIALLFFSSSTIVAQVGLSSDEQRLFDLVNHERKKAGLPPFQWSYYLAESARAHTQWMVKRKVLSHQFPGEASLGERVGVTGARFDGAAENVAAGDIAGDTVANLHDSLMNSPEHRANILSPKYNAVGLAIISNDGEMWVTEDFSHTVTSYSDSQFRDAVVASFNKARQARGLPPVTVINDPRIHSLACSESDKPQIPQSLSVALDTVVFTSSEPEKLPSDMQRAVADPTLHRISLGACFHPDNQHGFANFWVVAAFY